MRLSEIPDLAILAALFVASWLVYAVVAVRHDRGRIDRLEGRVACLEHPHGESSIAATRIGGVLVVTQPAHRTGCPAP